jgi:glyoxylase-like metal-dependent hydrolase (beta-lactamase superfamily II)
VILKIQTITVGAFAMNCYIISNEVSGDALFIDPGSEAQRLIDFVSKKKLRPQYIINTHCHIDHTAEVSIIQDYFQIPFYVHQGEKELLDSLNEQGKYFGITNIQKPKVTRFIEDNETLSLADTDITVIHTPGHSPGGISFKIDSDVFVGDALFRDSIGRTDLPGGDYKQLIRSIQKRLLSLEDNICVYPGHGPATTIGRERQLNPFLT